MKTRLLIIIGIAIVSSMVSLGLLLQIDFYDYSKYHTVFGPHSPLAEIGTGNPVLTRDNCERYAYWLTEHQKEKITLQEDFSVRYPPWGNQIFPLVEYCTKTGQLDKTVTNGMITWEFTPVRQGMHGLPSESEPESNPDSVPKWMIPEELAKIGCSVDMVNHLKKYSNAFDENWYGKGVAIEDIGLPWGVSQYALDQCIEKISELRDNELYGCKENDIYFRGVCMTPEAKEKAQAIGELENEN